MSSIINQMEVVFRTAVWFVLSGFMLTVLDMVSFFLKRSGWRRFVSTFLFFCSQIIVSQFVLGLLSILTAPWLLILNLAISTVLLYWLFRKSEGHLFRRYVESLRSVGRQTKQKLREDPFWAVLLALALAFVFWVIFLGVIFPSTDYDGNSYHLTFIGYVLQNHNFFDVQTSLPWLVGYPKGGEFIQLWTVVISHNDMFADLVQIPFLGLAVYALYEISSRLGASKRQARFAALLFVFIPIVLNQLKTTYVDVMLCSLFFAGLAMVIQKKLRTLDLLLVGIIFSFIISIKATGVLFVAALIPLLLWNLYSNRLKGKKKLSVNYLKPLAIIAIPAFFGLYWYVKNWIIHGSPIYPFGFKLLGYSIFPGKTFQEFASNAVDSLKSLPHGCVQRIWFVWTEQKDWFGCFYNYDTNFTGLGPIWFILLIPSVLLAGFYMIRKRRYQQLAVASTILVLFATYPTNFYSRYTMFITAIGIFALALSLDVISEVYKRIIKSFALVLVLSVIATNFVLCNFPPRVVAAQLRSLRSSPLRGAVYNTIPGPAFVFIEARLKPHDLVVYDSNPFFIYPLWRPDFSNEVKYLPSKNKVDWLHQLHSNGADYAFTTVYSPENKWARSSLHKVYSDELYEVYEVK